MNITHIHTDIDGCYYVLDVKNGWYVTFMWDNCYWVWCRSKRILRSSISISKSLYWSRWGNIQIVTKTRKYGIQHNSKRNRSPDSTRTSGRRRPSMETSASLTETSKKLRPGVGWYNSVSALFLSSSIVGPESVHDRRPMPRFSVCASPVIRLLATHREKRLIPATSGAFR